MNSKYEKIYFNSPVFLQNIFVSIYGLYLYRQRYNKNSKKYTLNLLKAGSYNSDEIHQYQSQLFVEYARKAIETVPFYREISQVQGFNKEDVRSLDDLKLFPVLSKQQILSDPELFVSSSFKKKKTFHLDTSGTTGTPLRIYCDSDSRSLHYSFFSRLRSLYGLKSRSRRMTFFGRIIMDSTSDKSPFWRHDIFQNNLLMSSYHLSSKNLYSYYKKIIDFEPEEIFSYPSSIYQLALFINKGNLPPVKLKLLMVTAETLMDYQKVAINQAFDAPLVNQYGCTEMAFFAATCPAGKMHIHPEHGIVESLNERHQNVFDTPGTLVATGLVNGVMPLIRYEVGDRIVLSGNNNRCECGSYFPVIDEIEGRVDDVLYRRDGTPVGRLGVFKGGKNILAAQIIQKSCGNITALVEVSEQYCDANQEWLRIELAKRMGNDITIDILEVDSIPKEKNGKFRTVVGNYKPC